MESKKTYALDQIFQLPGRIALTKDHEYITGHVGTFPKRGRNLYPHSAMDSIGYDECIAAGIYLLHDELRKAEFVLVNVDAGKGWFGRQKTKIILFGGKSDGAGYTPLFRYGTPAMLMFSLANLYNFGEFGPFGEPIADYPDFS